MRREVSFYTKIGRLARAGKPCTSAVSTTSWQRRRRDLRTRPDDGVDPPGSPVGLHPLRPAGPTGGVQLRGRDTGGVVWDQAGGLVWDQADGAFGSAAVPRPAGSSFMPLRRTHRRPDLATWWECRVPNTSAAERADQLSRRGKGGGHRPGDTSGGNWSALSARQQSPPVPDARAQTAPVKTEPIVIYGTLSKSPQSLPAAAPAACRSAHARCGSGRRRAGPRRRGRTGPF